MSLTPKNPISSNKTHFTPCRRVGLSRISKTPNSLTPISFVSPYKTPVEKITTPTLNETTQSPKVNNILKEQKRCDSNDTPISHCKNRPSSKKRKSTSVTAKCNLIEELNETSFKGYSTEEQETSISKSNSLTDLTYNENISLIENKTGAVKKYVTEEYLEAFATVNLDQSSTRKRVISSSEDEFVPQVNTKDCQIKIQRLSNEEIESCTNKTKNNDNNKVKTTKQNTKIKTQPVSDEEDAFTSSPQAENERMRLIEDIKKIKAEIKENQLKLDKLKQASIYTKKYNLDELQSLTRIWREGCMTGLKDLLKTLNENNANNGGVLIDMNMLIAKLGVPQHIRAQLPLELV